MALASLVSLLVLTTVVSPAQGGARVDWKKIEVRDDDGGARVAGMLRSFLKAATRKANFGKKGNVVLSARVVDLRWQERDDVVRLSVTLVGRIERGASAKSHISFGAAPKDRAALEKQVLTLVANGLVTRLAEIARTHPLPEEPRKGKH